MKTKKIDPNTPFGRLLIEKKEIRRLCQVKEQQLADDWAYIRNNAGRLLASELAAVFLKSRRNGDRQTAKNGSMPKFGEFANIAWQIARPLVYRWAALAGWRIIRSMFVRKRE